MSIQMFPCGSLSACLTKTFLVKEGHALMLLNIKRTEKRKVGGTCLFCLSQPTSRCLPESPDLCTPLLATDHYGIDCSYFAFPFPWATTCLKHLSESISGFWHGRLHKVDASLPQGGKLFSLMILFFSIIKLLLTHDLISEKVHTNFPYGSKLGVINELDVVRNWQTICR